jgi:hypothetical protein
MSNTYTPAVFRRNGGSSLCVTPSGVIEFLYDAGTEDTATAALLIGGGTASNPLTTAAAGTAFADFRTKSTNATGADSRGLYWRHYAAGAGASADCLRSFTTVTGAGAVAARGLHSTVSFSGSGTCTGEASAAKGTLQVPAGLTGTCAAICGNVNVEASGSVSGNAAGFRFALDGDPTAVATADSNAKIGVLSIDGVTINTGKLVHSSSNTATHGIRILINGAPYELLAKAL